MSAPKVLICTPVHYHIEFATQECIQNLRTTTKADVIGWKLKMGDSLISRVRNQMAEDFLKTDAEYMLTIDSDLVFPCGGFMPNLPNTTFFDPNRWKQNALDVLLSHQKDIISAVYFKKIRPHGPSLKFLEDGYNSDENDSVATKHNWMQMQGLLELRYVSTGFLLVHRKVFEAFEYPWYQPYVYEGEYLSEDWAFCQRAHDKGFSIYADPSLQLGHIGQYVFTAADYMIQRKIVQNGGKLTL